MRRKKEGIRKEEKRIEEKGKGRMRGKNRKKKLVNKKSQSIIENWRNTCKLKKEDKIKYRDGH